MVLPAWGTKRWGTAGEERCRCQSTAGVVTYRPLVRRAALDPIIEVGAAPREPDQRVATNIVLRGGTGFGGVGPHVGSGALGLEALSVSPWSERGPPQHEAPGPRYAGRGAVVAAEFVPGGSGVTDRPNDSADVDAILAAHWAPTAGCKRNRSGGGACVTTCAPLTRRAGATPSVFNELAEHRDRKTTLVGRDEEERR